MHKTHLIVAAAGLLVVLGGTAQAGGRGHSPGLGGPGGGLPSGLSSTNNPTGGEPKGWDQGKAWWKDSDTTGSTDTKETTLPPGLSGVFKPH